MRGRLPKERIQVVCWRNGLAFVLTTYALTALLTASTTPDLSGEWQGKIETPGIPLGVRVQLEHGEGGWSGTIDIPQQGAKGLPLEGIEIDGAKAAFSIRGVPGQPTFRGTYAQGEIRGQFSQSGARFPFVLTRGAVEEAADPPRPQEPKPPYPYAEREVVYRSGEVELAGTLTLPATPGPHPAVLLLSGSGAQNRDEEVFGHRPFLVIADHLARHGVAVLRVDDRGVGGSSGSLRNATAAELADDAISGVRFLRNREEIAADRVGLLGHSEGASVAALSAAKDGGVGFVVMLAAPGLPGRELLLLQNRRIFEIAGVPEETVRRRLAVLDGLLAIAPEGEERLRQKLQEETRAWSEAVESDGDGAPDPWATALEQQLSQLTSPWFLDFLSRDPRIALRQLRVPVLALGGALDLQVPPDPNQAELKEALAKAGNEDAEVLTLDGLNHLFQAAQTGLPNEYARIEETISPPVLERISRWMKARFAGPEPGEVEPSSSTSALPGGSSSSS